MVKIFIRTVLVLLGLMGPALAGSVDPSNWPAVLSAAKGQTVYWHAWGGEPRINSYIARVGVVLKNQYDVTLVQVKVTDTANVVAQVLAEKAAGKTDNGSVDLVWINGENFAAMQRQGLLATPGWADKLPNWRYVDVTGKPTVTVDFTVPTQALEAPWGMAQLVFMHDTARLPVPPKSADALLSWAKANPGRFTYPQPPNFHGTTFLKQLLIEKTSDPEVLARPVDDATFARVTGPLFAYLDELNPLLWRAGRAFPQNASALRQLLADNEIDIAFSTNPSDASSAIANNELPDTVRSFVFDRGTIGNTHFVAIPFNASAKEGALVVANLLMSPRMQALKQDPQIWGDPTVLDVAGLPAPDKARFEQLKLGVATLTPQALGTVLPEPHPSWVARLEAAWTARYGS